MLTLLRIVVIASVSLFVTSLASANQVATLQGVVKGVDSQPLRGAEIRIQGGDLSKIGRVHTDASGHYSYPGLETGTYKVSLIVDGVVKASINNVKTQLGEAQTLNFELQKGAAAKPLTKGKHYVWIPNITGSHLGMWVEVSDDDKTMSTGMQERIRNQGNDSLKQFFDEHPSHLKP